VGAEFAGKRQQKFYAVETSVSVEFPGIIVKVEFHMYTFLEGEKYVRNTSVEALK